MTAHGMRTNGFLNNQSNDFAFLRNCLLPSSPSIHIATIWCWFLLCSVPSCVSLLTFWRCWPRVSLRLKAACMYRSVLLSSNPNRMGLAFWRKNHDLPPLSNLVDIQMWKAGLQSQKLCSDKSRPLLALNLKYLYSFYLLFYLWSNSTFTFSLLLNMPS